MRFICLVSCPLLVGWLIGGLVGCNAGLTAMVLRLLKMLKSPKLKCHNRHKKGTNYNNDDDDADDNDDDDDDEGVL